MPLYNALGSIEQAVELAESLRRLWREQDTPQNLVLTNGCFDLLHIGHVRLFRFCRRHGIVFVAVDSDKNVRNLKGPGHPFFPAWHRVQVIAALQFVAVAFPFDGPVAAVVEALRPNILVKGIEWKDRVEGAEFAEVVLYRKRYGREPTTTSIINQIKGAV